jgi:hypothetical protein
MKAAAALALLALTGCASAPHESGHADAFLVPPQYDRVLLTFRWIQEGELYAKGMNAGATGSIPTQALSSGFPVAAVWTVKPKGFGDLVNVCGLGHEVLHALGARHEQLPVYPALYAIGAQR